MHYRPLGRTGLFVSDICPGTMTYGGKGRWEVVGRLSVADAPDPEACGPEAEAPDEPVVSLPPTLSGRAGATARQDRCWEGA